MKVEYEKQTCGRCGGSGQYSYNQIDGSRCYGCGGSGQKLTKRGAAAKAYADSILDVKIEDFAKLAKRKARYTDHLGGRRITFSAAIVSGFTKSKSMGEDWKETPNFTLLQKQEDGTYKPANIGIGAGITVRLIPTEEDIQSIMDYQANLTKAGKPRKVKG